MSDALWFTLVTNAVRLASIVAFVALEVLAFKLFSRRGRKESLAEGEISLWGNKGKMKGVGSGLALAMAGIALPIAAFSWHPNLTTTDTEDVPQSTSLVATHADSTQEKQKAATTFSGTQGSKRQVDGSGVTKDGPSDPPLNDVGPGLPGRHTTHTTSVSPPGNPDGRNEGRENNKGVVSPSASLNETRNGAPLAP